MKRFKNILFVMPHETINEAAFGRAVTLAEQNQAELTLIDVVPPASGYVGTPFGFHTVTDFQSAVVDNQRQKLVAFAEDHAKGIPIKTKVLEGVPFLEIIREVLRNNHDLLVKVAENGDLLDRIFGSDDMHILRKCPCPLLLLKPEAPKSHHRILAAVDVEDEYPRKEMATRSALNLQILELASSMALAESSELHIVHAWDAFGESALRYGAFSRRPETEVNAYVEKVQQQYQAKLDALMQEGVSYLGEDALEYLKPQTHLVKGRARVEIPALANRIEADLVVMGTVARTGVPGFIMGNTAENILNKIGCSVLAIKPPGFETPVTLEE